MLEIDNTKKWNEIVSKAQAIKSKTKSNESYNTPKTRLSINEALNIMNEGEDDDENDGDEDDDMFAEKDFDIGEYPDPEIIFSRNMGEGWIEIRGAVQNLDERPFDSFDDIDIIWFPLNEYPEFGIYHDDEEQDGPSDIPEDIKQKYLTMINEYVDEENESLKKTNKTSLKEDDDENDGDEDAYIVKYDNDYIMESNRPEMTSFRKYAKKFSSEDEAKKYARQYFKLHPYEIDVLKDSVKNSIDSKVNDGDEDDFIHTYGNTEEEACASLSDGFIDNEFEVKNLQDLKDRIAYLKKLYQYIDGLKKNKENNKY